ncbi:hypothetical protein EI94DRAFT_939971 [Lactarius quietus]|nr:hypothetical protein EI94DRAFT_939971 [Lactarius quietus]
MSSFRWQLLLAHFSAYSQSRMGYLRLYLNLHPALTMSRQLSLECSSLKPAVFVPFGSPLPSTRLNLPISDNTFTPPTGLRSKVCE